MNYEKLQKIFEIYKELNQEQKLEVVIDIHTNNVLQKNFEQEEKYKYKIKTENDYENEQYEQQKEKRNGWNTFGGNKPIIKNTKPDLTELKNRLLKNRGNSADSSFSAPTLKSNQILLVLKPKTFEIFGNIKNLSKDVHQKLMDEARHKIEEEHAALRLKLDDLKNKL